MIEVGRLVLSFSLLWIAIYWMIAGALCTLIAERRGLYLAGAIPLAVKVLPWIVWVNAPGRDVPVIQFFRFGTDVNIIAVEVVVPLFASIVGGLIGELILPSAAEE